MNGGTYNSATLNAPTIYPIAAGPGQESFTPLSEASQVTITAGADGSGTDVFVFRVEGDAAQGNGTLNANTFNALSFNSAPTADASNLWSIAAASSATDALTLSITESVLIAQRVDLNLSGGTSFVVFESLAIDLELNTRGRCSFDIIYSGAGGYRPQCGHQVKVTDYDGTTVLFAGTIERTDERIIWQQSGTHVLAIRCEAVGWEQVADRYIHAEAYVGQTVATIVGDLVTTHLAADGITYSGTTATTIDDISFDYERVSDCLTAIGEASGLWWRVTWDKQLELYDPTAASASGVSFTTSSNNWRSMSSQSDRSTYRNTQYLTGVTAKTALQLETFGGDNERRTFSLGYEVDSVTEIKVNGYVQTVGVQGQDTGKQWYYSVGSKEITQDGTQTTGYYATATDTRTIGTGSKVFTVGTGLSWTIGDDCIITYDADNTMRGNVVIYSGGQLEVNVTQTTGSGSYSAWKLNKAGAVGQTLGLTDMLSVRYYGRFPAVVKYTDAAEIANRQAIEGGTGVYEHVISDAMAMSSQQAAADYAQALVERYSPIGQTVTIETDQTGIMPGETVGITVTELGLFGAFFVSRVSARDVAGKRLRYTITCHSEAPSELWRRVFSRSAKSGLLSLPLTAYP